MSPALADGTYAVTATATDAAGNISAASAAFSLTIDTTAPSAPTVGLFANDDSGIVGDAITNVSRPRITGTAEAKSTINLTIAGTVVGTGVATGGTYTIQLNAVLADGIYAVIATATDAAGNVGAASPAFALTIDTATPAAPTLAILPADDTGVKGDGVTESHHYRVTGVAPPGSYVQLLDPRGNLLGGVTAASVGGAYTIYAPPELVGTFTYRTRTEDAAGNFSSLSAPLTIRAVATAGDYDGDGKADVITYDASTEVWSIRQSSTGVTTQLSFGLPNAVPVPADYDGDGNADLAVYQPSTGTWLIRDSSTGKVVQYTFGGPGCIPVPGDYTGVGHAEIGVYQTSTAQWFVSNPATNAGFIWTFGFPGQSIPVPAAYAGYGTADLAVYQPATGDWYSVNTTNAALVHTVFGGPGFAPVPGDYDGDGKADIALYYPAISQWIIIQSTTGTDRFEIYGAPNVDSPVPADYEGIGSVDPAVYWATGSAFGLDLWGSGTKQTVFLGQPGVDEPAVVPWSYVSAYVTRAGTVAASVAHPAAAIQPATTTAPATSAPLTPIAPVSVRLVASRPRGTLVAQAIKPKAWTVWTKDL